MQSHLFSLTKISLAEQVLQFLVFGKASGDPPSPLLLYHYRELFCAFPLLKDYAPVFLAVNGSNVKNEP